jgi:hypothetical protein
LILYSIRSETLPKPADFFDFVLIRPNGSPFNLAQRHRIVAPDGSRRNDVGTGVQEGPVFLTFGYDDPVAFFSEYHDARLSEGVNAPMWVIPDSTMIGPVLGRGRDHRSIWKIWLAAS